MVQVDVFWSYGIGSAFALAAYRQLRKLRMENEARRWKLGWKGRLEFSEPALDGEVANALVPKPGYPDNSEFRQLVQELRNKGIMSGMSGMKDMKKARQQIRRLIKAWMNDNSDALTNEYFVKNLLFLSLIFGPSGSVLLWSNPSWETMQVGNYETIPQWLVGIFATTNMTQGILGFLITYNLLMKGKYYQAALQTMLAHTAFYFILINGWDKTGYQRFFSKDRESFENWKWANVLPWLASDVARILATYGTVFSPLTIGTMYRWLRQGKKMEAELGVAEKTNEKRPGRSNLFMDLQTMVHGITFLNGLVAHLLIRRFGWVAGGGAAVAAIYLGGMSKWGVVPGLVKRVMRVDSLEAPPVSEVVTKEVLLKELVGISA